MQTQPTLSWDMKYQIIRYMRTKLTTKMSSLHSQHIPKKKSSSILFWKIPKTIKPRQSLGTSPKTTMGPKRAQIRTRIQSRNIIGRLTYSPEKHKQRFTKTQRTKLATRSPDRPSKAPPDNTLITFGSMNVNGLDQEAHWAVTEPIKSHNLDVSISSETLSQIKKIL